VEIVHRDETEIGVGRRIFAAQASRPRGKRKERAGTDPDPLPTSQSSRHEEMLSRHRSNTSDRPVIIPLPYPEGEREKSQIFFKAIIIGAVRAQWLQPCRRFDHLIVLHRWVVEKALSFDREEACCGFGHTSSRRLWTIT
jgi:hypothetical protein